MENYKAVVRHELMVGDINYTVGTTKITPTFGCALNEWEENIAPECDVEIRLTSKTLVGDDDWVCLYEVVLADNELLYYITGNKALHVKGKYHEAVQYAPLNADRIRTAIKLYNAEIMEWL